MTTPAAGVAAPAGAAVAAPAASSSGSGTQASRPPASPYSSERSESDDERARGPPPGDSSAQQPPPLPPLQQLRGSSSSSSHQAAADDDDTEDEDADGLRRNRRRRERVSPVTTSAPMVPAKVPESDDRSSFSGDEREMRVVLHGREVFAEDLVGLRVAKSFAGLGRFLGQVVRFDEPTSLFTVVYADGDAEELSVDHTIDILIQDDIERADPSLPPVAVTYASRGDIPEKSDAKGLPPPPAASQQQQQQQQQRSQMYTSQSPSDASLYGEPSGPRLAVQISEREAQFVVGLFENHALPVLLREGWKVQTSASGSEHRYYSPPGNFPGAGRMFISALAVVELIASNERMLSACFPLNVRAGIQSLFADSSRKHDDVAARKRMPSSHADEEVYDPKRQRAGRDSAGGPNHLRPLPAHPPSSFSQRQGDAGDSRSFHSDDVAMERERDVYPADRMPLGGGDRFGDGGSSASSRSTDRGGMRNYHHDIGEYGTPGGSAPMRSPPETGPVSHWPSGNVRSSPAPNTGSFEAEENRRQYAGSPGWRERGDVPSRGGSGLYSSGLSQPLYRDGYRGSSRSEGDSFYADPRVSRSSARMMPGGEFPPGSSFRYQDLRNSPLRGSPSVDRFHRQGSESLHGHPSLDSQVLDPRNPAATEYRMGSDRSTRGMSMRDSTSVLAPDRDAFMLRNESARCGAPSPADHQQQQLMQSKWGSHQSPRFGYTQSECSQSSHGGERIPMNGSHHHHRHHHQQQSQPEQQHQQQIHHHQQRMLSKSDGYTDSNGPRRAAAEAIEQRRAGSVGHSILSSSNQLDGTM